MSSSVLVNSEDLSKQYAHLSPVSVSRLHLGVGHFIVSSILSAVSELLRSTLAARQELYIVMLLLRRSSRTICVCVPRSSDWPSHLCMWISTGRFFSDSL